MCPRPSPIGPASDRMSNGPISSDVVSIQSSTQDHQDNDASPSFHRSASHTQLGKADGSVSNTTPEKPFNIHRSFSENILTNAAGNVLRKTSTSKVTEGPSNARRRSLKRLGSSRKAPTKQELQPQYTVSKFIVGADQTLEDVRYEPKGRDDTGTPEREPKTRSVSASISSFARKSWSTASRSPSPSPNKRQSRRDLDVAQDGVKSPSVPTNVAHGVVNGTTKAANSGLLRRNSILSKRSNRPLSSLLRRESDRLGTPSVPPIPKSFSTDKLPSLKHKSSTISNPPALPASRSLERLNGQGTETPRKKDDLWNVFRNLDGEYQKFQSRPSTLKTGVIRSALLPFLRTYGEHPSILSLRPEDLDRRTVILNKWWTGLLEMLNGRHGESVSGNDRPAVLEAATALMVRPEWTLPALIASSRATKYARASLKSRSTTSLGSTMTMSSDFLAESVYHNVRNTFTQNLLAQMAYVVDKMSMRSVAASVVAFCGKATAYAFFYCEGVAEILVRLWGTPSSLLRRVLAESGVSNGTKLDSISDRICGVFPLCLHSLSFRSLQTTIRHLRTRPHLPIATAYIPWHGPWIGRWAGRDTDLFYVFAKFFTDLTCRFFPRDPSMEERLAAPGWLLVQAQILSILDVTMQRANNQSAIEQMGPSSLTFDEVIGEADVSATVLPLPTNGAVRSMAENRLILLLRDCLSGSTVMTERTQSMFAQSFIIVLKATARRISVFDHNGCFALCDFLEEALAILTRYQQASEAAVAIIDWSFWVDVCKHMLQSHNSMTEVRLCAFLYAMWPTITSDPARRHEMCNNWLLTREIFMTQFHHWCPMVRAFFMRLLVWRVARADGNNPELDKSIAETLAERLQESWGHFLYNQENAGKALVAAPSTPAPGRRLLIVRNDVQPPTPGMFLSFDDILSRSTSKVNSNADQGSRDFHQYRTQPHEAENMDSRGSVLDGGKRRWNLLRSIMPNSSTAKDRIKPTMSTRQQGLIDSSRKDSQAPFAGSHAVAGKKMGPVSSYRSLSFKFSLEWFDGDGDPGSTERRLHPPRLPPLANLTLPSHEAADPNNTAIKPDQIAAGSSKYAGRALAEWALLNLECKNFVERRKAEGVPTHHMTETPTLGVEPFRR